MSGHLCDWCGLPFTRPAKDECVNPEHRSTDATLGLREAGCGCCYIVDATALGLLITACKYCQHYHGRGTNRCLGPGCDCPGRPRLCLNPDCGQTRGHLGVCD